jgi:hypothetical protein
MHRFVEPETFDVGPLQHVFALAGHARPLEACAANASSG